MKVIITGSTGMVGRGVLLECLDDSRISQVLLVNRNPIDLKHPKIKEVLHSDFYNFEDLKETFKGFDACFHCMGVSSAGISNERFHGLTFEISEALFSTAYKANPNMVATYVSGEGTDSSEKGKIGWARIKGKTENMMLNMGFKDAYAFRPGIILPERGVKSKTRLYNLGYVLMRPFFPLLRKLKSVTTSINMGKAMINLLFEPQELKHLEGADINVAAALCNVSQ